MAHEITKNDKMFSVHEKPWHGLGTVMSDYPTIADAITASGLDWTASLKKMTVPMTIEDVDIAIEVPDQWAIVRDDIHKVLGVVGGRYKIYQNDEMWKFIEVFQKESGIKLETAGSLKEGKTTWVLAKNGTLEAISGDPIEEYFLFRNSFDGSTPISCLFTNIRVVCNNTLTAAIRGARNIFNVRHTASADEQINEVQKALGLRAKYHVAVKEGFDTLVKHKMSATRTEQVVSNVIFPMPKKVIQTVENGEIVHSLAEAKQQAITVRNKKVDAVMEYVETGAGADIPGVRGTAYGLWQAITEWVDHGKTVRTRNGRKESEVRFENAFYGAGAKFKMDTFTELMKIAA